VPYVAAAKELKTKPTQHSVKKLQEMGIQPDVLVLRTEKDVPTDVRRKIALFCNVAPDAVVQSIDVPSIYEVPVKMQEQHLDEIIMRLTGVEVKGEPDMAPWMQFLNKMTSAEKEVKIGIVGKYVELPDAYISIKESLFQAATYNDRKRNVTYIQSEKLNDSNVADKLKDMDGVIVAPGA
jgi:CTP synthase